MPATAVTSKSAKLTADGTAAGWVTIATGDGWLVGTLVSLRANGESVLKCKVIAKVAGTGELRLREIGQTAQYGFTNVSAYTTAKAASISRRVQVVAVNTPFVERERV